MDKAGTSNRGFDVRSRKVSRTFRAVPRINSVHIPPNYFRRSVITANLLAFLLDLYTSSNRVDPDIVKLRAVVRTLLKPRSWTRQQLAVLLADEVWSNWWTIEQKAKLSNLFLRSPDIANMNVPMAWSPNEALATQWKITFETLKLWAPLKQGDSVFWVPMVWPSYLAALRWQLLLSTRSRMGPRVTLPPNMVGFPITGMMETKVLIRNLTFSANIHFLVPEEDVLR